MWIIIAINAIPAIKVNRNEVFFSNRLINAINELQYKVINDDFPPADAEYMSGKPFLCLQSHYLVWLAVQPSSGSAARPSAKSVRI